MGLKNGSRAFKKVGAIPFRRSERGNHALDSPAMMLSREPFLVVETRF
jgi:hypothetical protein